MAILGSYPYCRTGTAEVLVLHLVFLTGAKSEANFIPRGSPFYILRFTRFYPRVGLSAIVIGFSSGARLLISIPVPVLRKNTGTMCIYARKQLLCFS